MKRSILLSALAIGVFYLIRQLIGQEEETPQPPKKHLTNAFSKAKERAVSAAEQG